MGNLTENFSRDEFACNCGCGRDTIDIKTMEILQAVRDHYGRSVVITSGYRCADWNRHVGGASNSQHLYGRAADFKVSSVAPKFVAGWIEVTFPSASIGRYPTFTHVDTRTGQPARWGD